MVNFAEAARRHFEDADLLKDEKRLHNADQMYGLSAECALKEIMIVLGAEVTDEGDLTKPHKLHIDVLWSEFQSFAAGRRSTRYLGPLSAFPMNPFSDWKIEQRYFSSQDAPAGSSITTHWRASRACLVALQRAKE